MIYTYEMPWGETLKIKANLEENHADILIEGVKPGTWDSTPFNTASAHHDERTMLRLVVGYLGSEWYARRDSHLSDDEQLDAAVDGAERQE